MGICNSITKKPVKTAPEPVKEKRVNPHSTISGEKNTIVIKHIGEIHGDMVKIDTCVNSTIIILDISSQVIITECRNCNIFVAPCIGSVSLRKSEGINLISASSQLRCTDLTNSKAAIYVNTQPALEKTKNLSIGCFFFSYIELPDLFTKAALNVWNNLWSEVHDFTPASTNVNYTYFNPKEDSKFKSDFINALKDQDINIDEYFPVPFTKGRSMNFNETFSHAFLIVKDDTVDRKFYDHIADDTLTRLIKTVHMEKNNANLNLIQSALRHNGQEEKNEFFSVLNKSTNNMSKEGYVLFWLVDDKDKFFALTEYFMNEMTENFLLLTEQDLGKMQELVKKVFKGFDK